MRFWRIILADNVGYTPGAGASVAADDVGGVLYQRVKIVIGDDGTIVGDVSSANPIPVSASSLPLPSGASTSALQTTGNTSLSNLDSNAGAQADAAVVTDTTGTLSGKLRGLIKWAFERMPASLGQKAMAASLPVVIASDQTVIPASQSGTWSVRITDSNGEELETSAHGRLSVGMESFLFYDRVDGTTINSHLWQFDVSAFGTPTQSSGYINLNVTPTVAAGYARLFSRKNLSMYGHFPIYIHVMGAVTALPATSNAQFLEIGIGTSGAGTAAPTDGAFFRLFHDGTAVRLMGVTVNSSTGVEKLSATTTFTPPAAGARFTWIIILDHSSIKFRVGTAEEVVAIDTTVATPFSTSRLPLFMKERNTGAVGAAIRGKVSEFVVALRDAHNPKTWAEQMSAASAQGAHLNPSTFAAAAFFPANSSAYPTATTVSNTAAPATWGSSLGGMFNFTCPTPSATTDNILFAFQVPAGLTLYISSICFSNPWVGTILGATALKYDFWLAVNSTAVSLATADVAGTSLARRFIGYLGRWQAAASSAADTFLNRSGSGASTSAVEVAIPFNPPVVVESGQFVHVFFKALTGPTTGSIQGVVRFGGYFE